MDQSGARSLSCDITRARTNQIAQKCLRIGNLITSFFQMCSKSTWNNMGVDSTIIDQIEIEPQIEKCIQVF